MGINLNQNKRSNIVEISSIETAKLQNNMG